MIAYGMSPYSLNEKLNAEGYPIVLEKSKDLFKKYEEEFRVGIDYLRDSGQEALENGVLSNLNGRRRYWILPDKEDKVKYPKGIDDPLYTGRCGGIRREGGNFKIQSVNADMTKYAMVLLRKYIKKEGIRSKIMNQVYDEIVTRTHKDDTEKFHKMKQALMKEAAQNYLKVVPMEVDGHVGPCWTK